MVKHTQTICRQLPKNCLSVFDHFVELMLKGLSTYFPTATYYFGASEHFYLQIFGSQRFLKVLLPQLLLGAITPIVETFCQRNNKI